MVHGQRSRPPYNPQVMLRQSWWLTKCILWSCTKNSRDVKFLALCKEFCWHCWLTCTLAQPIMIPRKRITLSSSVTTIGFNHTVYSWLQSYLIGRYQSVHVDRQSCTPTLSTFGVPRGSVLGLLLFFYLYFPISSVHSMFSTVSTLMTPTPCRSFLFLFLPPAIQLTSNLTHSFTHCLSTHDSV